MNLRNILCVCIGNICCSPLAGGYLRRHAPQLSIDSAAIASQEGLEQRQLDWITAQYPMARGRVFLASHWQDGVDVDDPYRHSTDFFDRVYGGMTGGWRIESRNSNECYPVGACLLPADDAPDQPRNPFTAYVSGLASTRAVGSCDGMVRLLWSGMQTCVAGASPLASWSWQNANKCKTGTVN